MANVEMWKQVVGFEGVYEVSDRGRFRSLDRIDGIGRSIKGRILKGGFAGPQKRPVFLLYKEGKNYPEYLSRIVLTAFVGASEGMYCCHNNGNPHDNRLENLRWGTPAENSADMKLHGTCNYLRGEIHPKAKLTAEDVRQMRRLRAAGHGVRQLARDYNMDRKYVSRLLRGIYRSEVPMELA